MTRIDRWCNKVTNCIVVFGLMCLVVGACNSSERATNKVYRGAKINRIAAGKACVDLYPTKDSIQIQTEYKQGETIRDTFTNIEVQVMNDTVYIYSTKVINNHTRDTAYLRITTTKENTAKIDYLNKELANTSSDLIKRTEGRNNWRVLALSALGVLLIQVVVLVVKLYRKSVIGK